MRSVLMFHGVGTPVAPQEPGEHAYWIDWNLFDAIVEHCTTLPPQEDRFTFDDGNESDLEAALRMRRRGQPGHFFVLVGRVGQQGYLNADQLRELLRLGMKVGLHGRDHVDWRLADNAALYSEIDLAADELSAICSQKIDTLAIPYGAYDRRVWNYLKRSRFSRIYTSDCGVSPPHHRFIRRNPVMKSLTVDDVKAMLQNKASPLTRLRRQVMPHIKRRI